MACKINQLRTVIDSMFNGSTPKELENYVTRLENEFASKVEVKPKSTVSGLINRLKDKQTKSESESESDKKPSGADLLNKLLAKQNKDAELSVSYSSSAKGVTKAKAESIINSISSYAASLLKSGKVQLVDNTFVTELMRYDPGNINMGTRTIEEIKDNFKFSMVGVGARNARKNKLNEALKLLESGKVNSEELYDKTGWELSIDGKLQYRLKTRPNLKVENVKIGRTTLGELVDYKELFDEYPYITDLPVKIINDPMVGEAGKYSAVDGITLNIADMDSALIIRVLNTLGHETQHAIQFTEAMAGGTNIDNVDKKTKAETKKEYEVLFSVLNDLKLSNYDTYLLIKNAAENKQLDLLDSNVSKLLITNANKVNDPKFADLLLTRLGIMFKDSQLKEENIDFWAGFETYLKDAGEVNARAAGEFWAGIAPEYPAIDKYATVSTNTIVTAELPVVSAIQGIYVKKDNNLGVIADPTTAYINLSVVTEDTLPGVFMHEVGVHAVLDMLNTSSRSDLVTLLLDKAESLYNRGLDSSNPKINTFFKRINKRISDSKTPNSREELLAYIVEESVNTLKDGDYFKAGESLMTTVNSVSKYISPAIGSLIKDLVELFVKSISRFKNKELRNSLIKVGGKNIENAINDLDIQVDMEYLINVVNAGVEALAESNTNKRNIDVSSTSSDNALAKLYNAIINNDVCE